MALCCEINLNKPQNEAYFGSVGTLISGEIKYAIRDETVFNKIIVSLEGFGSLCIEENQRKKNVPKGRTVSNETYLDLRRVVHNDSKNAVGVKDTQFKFEIPRNLPPSLTYIKDNHSYNVRCEIAYYITIKFYISGCTKVVKRFRKEITVISGIVPRFAMIPIVYGDQVKLITNANSEPNIFLIKATIFRSVVKVGDKIVLHYEVSNDTNIDIIGVETKLMEVYKFFAINKRDVKIEDEIPGSVSKTASISSGETKELSVEINLPQYCHSSEFSQLFSRDYSVFITVELPTPHKNYTLELPVQIGAEKSTEGTACEAEACLADWQTMTDYTSDNMKNASIT